MESVKMNLYNFRLGKNLLLSHSIFMCLTKYLVHLLFIIFSYLIFALSRLESVYYPESKADTSIHDLS